MSSTRETSHISCTFHLFPKGKKVEVAVETPDHEPETRLYTISIRWDPQKSKCRVVIWGSTGKEESVFPHKHLWKVVQYILEPFFFENGWS